MLALRYDTSKWHLNTRLNATTTESSVELPPRPIPDEDRRIPGDDRHSGANWTHAVMNVLSMISELPGHAIALFINTSIAAVTYV